MTVSTSTDIASALAVARRLQFAKVFTASRAIGFFQSGWLGTGLPAAGVASPVYTAGSGYTCSSATTGAVAYVNAAVKNFLAKVQMSASLTGTLHIVDRLWSCSGMGFGVGTYTVTTPGALPARITDNGLQCELWQENFVACGAASGTLTAQYLDSNGAAKTGAINLVTTSPVAGYMQMFELADNLGIKQLTSIANSATFTSGTYGATILKRIATMVFDGGQQEVFDWSYLGLPALTDDMCLQLMWVGTTTPGPTISGNIHVIDK